MISRQAVINWASLILRIFFGGLMAILHGWPKLASFPERATGFYDFLGLGGPVSLGLAVFAEFFCAVLLVLGAGTRVVTVPLMITMAVAFLMVHGGDPLSDREGALTYFAAFAAIFVLGPGRFSVDNALSRRNVGQA